jgi:hypothetical protein
MYATFSSSTKELDWEDTVTLPGDVTTRRWPPQGSRNLTPDQRKLQWEFMVFQYEQSSGRVSSLNRAGRLDTYNMFAYSELLHMPK